MIYQFDSCTFDTQRFELYCDGQPIALRRKAFQLLAFLLVHSDRAVAKEELLDHLWPGQFIGDAALSSCLREVRRAIGDNGRSQRVIRTIRGSGYRVVVPVVIEAPPLQTGATESEMQPTGQAKLLPEADLSQRCFSCECINPLAAQYCNACASPLTVLCPVCHQALPAGARFCHHCGASAAPTDATLAPQPMQQANHPLARDAERRYLSVMFCGIVDAKALVNQLDPEDWHDIVQPYQNICTEVISRFGGYIAQYLGDGLLVYFGYPQAHEDDAHRALRAGLEMIEAIRQAEMTVPQSDDDRLSIRIGVHTGLVVIGGMGGSERQERLALGEVPNVAAQLHNLAEPDALVISEATHRLVQGFFICESRGEQQWQGLGQPMHIYRVMQTGEAQNRFDVISAEGRVQPLAGRTSEMNLLRDRWQQTADGFAQMVILSGEAGIGKSRLVQALKDHVAAGAHTLVECRCSAYHQHSALYALLEPLQRLLKWSENDTPESKLAKLEQTLQQLGQPLPVLVPLAAALLSLPLPAGRYPAQNLSPEQQRTKWLETIMTLILALADREPVLLIIEDLHWSDPTTRAFLDLLVAQDPSVRLLTVLTCRPDFEVPWSIRDHLSHLTLNRLPPADVEQLVLQLTNGIPLPTVVHERLLAQTDGVPLFIEEMVKTIFESGLLKPVGGHYELRWPVPNRVIPATLNGALMARLDRLGTGKSVAQLGAVIGRQFDYHVLQAASPWPETVLQDALTQLVEADLVRPCGVPWQRAYVFKHALIQDAAYQSLLRGTRRDYHGRIANVLISACPDIAGHQPEAVAHHYTEAGEIEASLTYWLQAGLRARQRTANDEAIYLLTRGLELLAALPETTDRDQMELRFQARLGACLMESQGYASPEVERAYLRARELCQRTGNTTHQAPVIYGLWLFFSVRGKHRTAHELAAQLMSLAEEHPDLVHVIPAHITMGITRCVQGAFDDAYAHLSRAASLYDPAMHQTLISMYATDPVIQASCCLMQCLVMRGYPDQAMQKAHEILSLARRLDHPFSLGFALIMTGDLFFALKQHEIAWELAEELQTRAREYGFRQWEAIATVQSGCLLMSQGERRAALEQLIKGVSAYRATGAEVQMVGYLVKTAQAHLMEGQLGDGQRLLEEALDLMHRQGSYLYAGEVYWWQAQFALKADRPNLDQAERLLQLALDTAAQQHAKMYELRAAMGLCQLWQRQGQRTKAHALLSQLYHDFSEGFDTAPLQAAAAILREMAA